MLFLKARHWSVQNRCAFLKIIEQMSFGDGEAMRRTVSPCPERYSKTSPSNYAKISSVKEQLTGTIICYRVSIDFRVRRRGHTHVLQPHHTTTTELGKAAASWRYGNYRPTTLQKTMPDVDAWNGKGET